jgi:uncharacterized BrkB/YihY/UPF0761 family membrane protein
MRADLVVRYVRSMDELKRLNSTSDSMDEPFGSLVRRRRRDLKPPVRRVYSTKALAFDLIASIVLTVGQGVGSGYLIFLNLFLGFAFDACGDPHPPCNYVLGTGAWFIVPIVSVVVLITTILLVAKNRRKSRLSWWIPLAGIATTSLSLGIAMLLTSIAIGRPLA